MRNTKETLGMVAAWTLLLITVEMLAHASVGEEDKVETTAMIRSDYEGFTGMLKTLLKDEARCTPSLQGATFSEPLDIKDPSDSTLILAAVGDYHEIGWTITRLELRNVQWIPGTPMLRQGELYLELRKEMATAIGAPTIHRKISDLIFETDQDRILRCYAKG
jgi:hypothetical protein